MATTVEQMIVLTAAITELSTEVQTAQVGINGAVTSTGAAKTAAEAARDLAVAAKVEAQAIATSVANWTVVSSAYQARAGDRILANTSANPFVITLPASPSEGAGVWIKDAADTFGANPLTIARNGQTFNGDASDLVANVLGAELHLFFRSGTWRF